jgi:hypothetical protein
MWCLRLRCLAELGQLLSFCLLLSIRKVVLEDDLTEKRATKWRVMHITVWHVNHANQQTPCRHTDDRLTTSVVAWFYRNVAWLVFYIQ